MNLFIARTTLQSFDYQMPKAKVATLQRLAPKQELIFAIFSQHPGWCQVSDCYLVKYSKALAITDYLPFKAVINNANFIYNNSVKLDKKALIGIGYSRPLPLVKSTVKL